MLLTITQAILVAALFSPLLVAKTTFFPFITSKAIVFRILIELALLAYLLHITLAADRARIWEGIKEKLRHPIVRALGAFAVLFTITAFTAVNPTQAFWSNFERGEGAFQILHYFLFFLLTVLSFTDLVKFRRMLAMSIFVSVPMCIYAAIQRWGTEGSFGVIAFSPRSSGTLGNPSYLAAYLLFTMALVIYFLMRAKSVRAKILYYLLLAFQLTMLFNTGTRGAFLGLIGAIITVVTVLILRSHSKKIKYAALGALVLSVASISIFFATASSPFWTKLPGVGRLLNLESALNDIRPRLWTWGTALSGVMEKPVLGWGAENFPFPFDKYYNPKHFGIESFFDRAHNNYLEMASSGGIPLLILYLLPFFFYYRELHRRQHTAWNAVLYAVPVAYLIQTFFLFDVLAIYIVHYLFLAFFINSAHPDSPHVPDGEAYNISGKQLLASTGLTIGTVVLIWVTALVPLQKNLMLVRALQLEPRSLGGSNPEEARQNAEQAAASFNQYLAALQMYSPIGQEEAMSMFNKYVVRILEQGKLGNTEEVAKIVGKANEWYDASSHLVVGVKDAYINGGLNLRAGVTYKLPEYLERGKKMYAEGLAVAPTRVELIQVLLNIARYENNTAEVEKILKTLKALRPDIDF